MRKPRIEELIMSCLFAPRRDLDPSDWQTHIRRNIVPEVRAETQRFYGPTDCIEAQYPGLDYNKLAHRLRLSHFPYHRRLFRVFDLLRLSDSEIQALCKWEGTRYARESYQASSQMKIRDTTWEGVTDYKHRPTTANRPLLRGGHLETAVGQLSKDAGSEQEDDEMEGSTGEEEASEEGSEDEMQQSVGVDLNQRLLAATEARARGENVVIDADWEQWMKEAAERGIHYDAPRLAESTLAASATGTPVYWSREIPAALSENLQPETGALQASLPPSVQ